MDIIGKKALGKDIEKVVHKYVQDTADITVRLSTDFYFLYNKDRVLVSLYSDIQPTRTFSYFFGKVYGHFPRDGYEYFVLSMLHEIGHYFTYDDFDEMDYPYFEDLKEGLQKRLAKDPENDTIYSEYYYIPVEKAATDWAMDWIAAHPKKYEKLYAAIKKAIKKFFKKNRLTK